jgi:hypothetical protein
MSVQEIEIPRRLRKRLLLAAWAVALLIPDLAWAVVSEPRFALPRVVFGVVWVWNFPSGMLFLLFRDHDLGVGLMAGVALFVLVWLCYLGLTLLAFRQRRRLRYFVVYGLLCALLLFTAVGCVAMIADVAKHGIGIH